jgi:hypothetical protein
MGQRDVILQQVIQQSMKINLSVPLARSTGTKGPKKIEESRPCIDLDKDQTLTPESSLPEKSAAQS